MRPVIKYCMTLYDLYTMKECRVCNKSKSLELFNKESNQKDGHATMCKECRSERRLKYKATTKAYNKKAYHQDIENQKARIAKWRKDNTEKTIDYSRKYYQKNAEERKAFARNYRVENPEKVKAAHAKWMKENPEKLNSKRRERRAKRVVEDLDWKFRQTLRQRVSKSLKSNKNSTTEVYLGATIDTAREHIESLFEEGMSWSNNTTTGWHIDHIIPSNLFDYSNQRHILASNNYLNLQPLWYHVNTSKQDKYMDKPNPEWMEQFGDIYEDITAALQS